ncbi:leucyl aminopeptidase [Candidatus Dojkabacteria bacterium]|uniref:Probable cytosol aminopeptidase n=1 Tax=Candidatus Dojkabacteria bacterium TaxID=2099670 RepID=A0A5C7J3C6_9BACT|nr:MAG: leucyl aminopeptidase [Candidatus Dojkabacteria bacterium]
MVLLKTITAYERELHKGKEILHVFLCENTEQIRQGLMHQLFPLAEFADALDKESYNFSSSEAKMFQIFSKEVIHNLYFKGILKAEDQHNALYFESIRTIAGEIVRYIKKKKIIETVLTIHLTATPSLFQKIIEIFSIAVHMAAYSFDLFLTKKDFSDFKISFFVSHAMQELYNAALHKAELIGRAVSFSRYLSDLPASHLYPERFVEIVLERLKKSTITNCSFELISLPEMEKLGMGGLIGVGKGSTKEPKLLILKYKPDVLQETKTVALVGKGVTFDTGGISIKPSDGMEDMKADMSGAAAAASAFLALAELKTPYTLYAVLPLAENMVDGNAYRPGDILTFYNKKTAEIKNTDAEGRLILADALAYASAALSPHVMIDLATLTGAARIALGPLYAGLMSESEELVKAILRAGEQTYERCWRMPLEEGYKPNMASHVADMCNIGTKGYKAGTTMGGMFLREFVSKEIKWAHLDIAPVATDCPTKTYLPSYGATGFGVRLLIELFEAAEYL